MCMWALLLLDGRGKKRGRGVEWQRGLFFKFIFMNIKRRAVRSTYAKAQKAARPASSRLDWPDTK